MEIKITKDNYGHLYAVEGVVAMFQFGYQADRNEWLFWMPGRAYDPTIIKGKLSRWQGISLLGIYAAYCVLQFVVLPNFA